MAKILTIIVLTVLIGGGGWYYTNKMITPTEGDPVSFGSGRGVVSRSDNKPLVVIFPNSSSVLIPGEKVKTTWKNSNIFDLLNNNLVNLVNVSDSTKKPVNLGTLNIRNLVSNSFEWTVPAGTVAGNYKIAFNGRRVSESEVFKIASSTPTTPVNNSGPAVFSKMSSNLTVIKNNTIDVGVNASFQLTIQANGSNIYASGTTAIVVLKDVATGKVITEKMVTVVPMESGMMYFVDGARKPISIDVVFPASIFPAAGSAVKASIYSINYTTFGSPAKPSATYTALDFGLYDTHVVTIIGTAPTTPSTGTTSVPFIFTRDLKQGDSGSDVTALKKILAAKGFGILSTNDFFDEATRVALAKYQTSVGISPANGILGAISRAKLNNDILNR